MKKNKIFFEKSIMGDCTYQILSLAIRKNSTKLVKNVLQKQASFIKNDNWTDYLLLIQALQQGRKQIAKILLNNGCRVNRKPNTNFFHTPLYYAVRLGDIEIVSLLLEKDADINGRDYNRETPLCLAMRLKYFTIVKLMLSEYFNQNKYLHPYINDHFIAYCIACLTFNDIAITNFVDHGISVRNSEECIPWYKNSFKLHYAVNNEYVELVELLLKCGATVTERNEEGLTPLHLAFLNYAQHKAHKDSSEKMIDLMLLTHNEIIENCIDNNGISHFHIACTRDNPKIVEGFLKCGVEVNKATFPCCSIFGSYTALHCAAYFHCKSVISLLLQYNADINAINGNGLTALHMTFIVYAEEDLKYQKSCQNVIDLMLSMSNEKIKNCVNPDGLSHFHIACCRGNVKIVDKLLECGARINGAISVESHTLPSYTPLHCAVKYNKINVVQLLLHHNANINASDAKRSTPLHLAWTRRDKYYNTKANNEIIDLLLLAHNRNNENTVDAYGLSLFHIICSGNNLEIVKVFLNQNVEINKKVFSNSKVLPCCTPLHFAVIYNRVAIVKLLLQHHADVNIKGLKNRTPLYTACELNFIKMHDLFSTVIGSQKDQSFSYPQVQFKNESDEVKDWKSKQNDHLEIITLLLKHGSDVNIKDAFNEPLLLEIAKKFKEYLLNMYYYVNEYSRDVIKIANQEFLTRCKKIIKIILEHNCEIDICDYEGNTILHVLASALPETSSGITEIFELILNKRANINATSSTGMTPLHIAIKSCQMNLVELLIKYNADINAIELKENCSPLHLACKYYSKNTYRYRKIIDSLIAKGANVNAKNKEGITPIHLACKTDPIIFAKMLSHGADINSVDKNGKTVMDYFSTLNSSLILLIRIHIHKLKEIGFTIHPKLFNFYLQTVDHVTDNDFFNDCRNELNYMKSLKIDYLSLYDIFKDFKKMTKYVKNNILINIMNLENFDDMFPLFGCLLKLQFEKSVRRNDLLNYARIKLLQIIKIVLPEICYNNILQYFSNEELEELNTKNFIVTEVR